MILRVLLSLVAASIVFQPGHAQEPATFPGTDLPITMAAADLTAEFRPLKLKEQSSGIFGDYYASYAFGFGGLNFGREGSSERVAELAEILPVAWTKSEMVEVYGQKFVATYIMEPSLEDLRAFSQGQPLKSKQLKLKLMKADQIGSIEPYPELTREKYVAILGRLTDTTNAPILIARSKAQANIQQMVKGLLMYLEDNDDIVPYVQSSGKLHEVILPYVTNKQTFQTSNPQSGGTFRLNMGLAGVNTADVKSPAEMPVLYDPVPWPDETMLVAFLDGHTKFVSVEAWPALQKHFKPGLKRHGKPIK